jgi:hypothetical protein
LPALERHERVTPSVMPMEEASVLGSKIKILVEAKDHNPGGSG